MDKERLQRLKQQKKLLRIVRKEKKYLFSFKSVHHVDIGFKYIGGQRTGVMAIRFHVFKKHDLAYLLDNFIPAEIEGIPTDVLVYSPIDNSRQGIFFNNILGGIEIENAHINGSGTLGCVLSDANGQPVGLTNYHVLYDVNSQPNDDIIQPADALVKPNEIIGQLINGDPQYDCAIFSLNQSRPAQVNFIEGFQYPVSGTSAPVTGDTVKKSGMITEVTFGIIDGVDLNGRISIGSNPLKPNPGNITQEGDSGSLWVLDDDKQTLAVALHNQSDGNFTTAFAWDINKVLNSLNIHF